jgi:hypothetical protein
LSAPVTALRQAAVRLRAQTRLDLVPTVKRIAKAQAAA